MRWLLISFILLTGCTSVFDGKGDVVSKEVATVGEYDESYYRPTLEELKRFNIYLWNRRRTVQWSRYWDCDDHARDYVNAINRKYANYPHGGQSVAVQTHMIVIVETSDSGRVMVEPQTKRIVK